MLKRRSLPALATGALLIAFCAASAADELEHVRKAPPLTFADTSGAQHSLSEYKNKVVALEFIYTTCPHCQSAAKLMSQLQTEYGPRGLQVIDVAVNNNSDLLIGNFAKDFHVNFPVGWTTPDQMTSFMGWNSSERWVVPQLVLIDRNGMIHYQTPANDNNLWPKYMTEDAIRKHIQQLLAIR